MTHGGGKEGSELSNVLDMLDTTTLEPVDADKVDVVKVVERLGKAVLATSKGNPDVVVYPVEHIELIRSTLLDVLERIQISNLIRSRLPISRDHIIHDAEGKKLLEETLGISLSDES